MKKLLIFVLILLLCACNGSEGKLSKQKVFLGTLQDEEGQMVLPLNTEVYMTIVRDKRKVELADAAEEVLYKGHMLLDSHRYYAVNEKRLTNLKVLNESFNKEIEVDPLLFEAIKESLILTKLTEGYFNPTVGKVSLLYEGKFVSYPTTDSDPDSKDMENALKSVIPYEVIDKYIILNEEKHTVKFLTYNGERYVFDLGAFSKGFVLDKVYDALKEKNTSFLLSAGYSSLVSYAYENEVNWSVGSVDPDENTKILFAFNADNDFISTSGDYEQYYLLEDGTRRHHILNPYTGYSEDYYRMLIVRSSKYGGVLDCLSTALFSLSDEETIERILKNVSEYYEMKIDYCYVYPDLSIKVSKGFNDTFMEDYFSDKITGVEVR